MDFARKQMEKYGWKEGQGLGKNEDGIAAALKPKLKFDKGGVGHDPAEQFNNNWWEKLYNSASDNLNVQVKESGVKVKRKTDESIEITNKSYSLKALKKVKSLHYGSFLKTSKLTQDGIENFDVPKIDFEETKPLNFLSDEQLLAACGGRTAHKGARHGLNLTGKLARIEKQEKMLLKKMKNIAIADEEGDKAEKKFRKLQSEKEKCKVAIEDGDDSLDALSTCSSNSFKKKKKKKRKSVWFSENVTEYVIPQNEETDKTDEGIEQDIEDCNERENNDHRSFEEAQLSFDDLSKAERKKLKKKRKMKNSATAKFLQEVLDDVEDESMDVDKFNNCKKRKCNTEENCFSACKRNLPKAETQSRIETRKDKKKKKKSKDHEQDETQITSIAKSLNFCKITGQDLNLPGSSKSS